MSWYEGPVERRATRSGDGAANGTKTTPAMASGLTDRVWTVKDIIALMDPATARVQ